MYYFTSRAPPSSLVFPPPPWQPGYALDRERGDLADGCLYSVAVPGVVFADPAIRSGKPEKSHLKEPSDEVMGGFLGGKRGRPS